jgi:hypothetical protein
MAADDDLVIVYETDWRPHIAMVRLTLQQADIPFTAINDVVSGIYPIDGMAVVRFQVLARDAARARQAIEDLHLH